MRVVRMNAFPESGHTEYEKYTEPEAVWEKTVNSDKNDRDMIFDIRKIASSFKKDDYILAGLILILILEGCDDYILLAALGYLFIMGL